MLRFFTFRKVFYLLFFLFSFSDLLIAQSSIQHSVDPKASFLRRDPDDATVGPLALSLVSLGVNPGQQLTLVSTGAFDPCYFPPDSFCGDTLNDTIAVFSSSAILLGPSQLNRIPGAISAGLSFVTLNTFYSGLSTDIPEDFFVATGTGTTVTVPPAATFLFVAPSDAFTGDNGDPNGDYGIRITSSTPIPPAISFNDVSQTSGIANQNVKTTGVQWIDYNSDKRLDLFFIGSNTNALFRNNGDQTFTEVTAQSKLGNLGVEAIGASWADIDNDGDPDLFIAGANGELLILENRKGVFVDVSGNQLGDVGKTAVAGIQGGIWLDFNNDKIVDLFIVADGLPNKLLKRSGFAGYEDIAAKAHLNKIGPGRSAIAADFNNDGFQDIFLVNYRKSSKLYLNNGDETFQDITKSAEIKFKGASTQAAVADYDRDGFLDIFIVNSAGTSRLYRNKGDLTFEDKTKEAKLTKPKKGIAAAFADFDIDGDEDLVVVQSSGGNFVFQNNGLGRFEIAAGVDLTNSGKPTGIAVGDFDGNGTPDIAIGDGDSDQSLYSNTGGPGNNYLTVILKGKESNRSAIGGRVVIKTAFTFQVKTVSAGNGQTQESLPVEFGLGVAPKVELINISWPSGKNQTVKDINANKRVTIVEN